MLDLFNPPKVAPAETRPVPLMSAGEFDDPNVAPSGREGYWRDYHQRRSAADPAYVERRRQRAREHWEKKHGK